MFFGCKKAGKLYWALRRSGLTQAVATRRTLLAWFTMRDSTLDTVLSYANTVRRGVLVLTRMEEVDSKRCVGVETFRKSWYGFPTRRVDPRFKMDLVVNYFEREVFTHAEGALEGIPVGTLVRVRDGYLLGAL